METFKRFMRHGYVLTTCLLLSVTWLVWLGIRLGLGKQDWPGWVQAVGSIAALGVAIFVMSRQNRHAVDMVMKSDRRALLRRASAVSILVDNGKEIVDACTKSLAEAAASDDVINECLHDFKINRPMIKVAIARLEVIPIHELGSREIAGAVFDMIDCLEHYGVAMDMWLAGNAKTPIDRLTALQVVGHFRSASDAAHDRFAKGLAILEAAEF